VATIKGSDVKKLIVACEAAMGSSIMLASTLRNQLKRSKVVVEHTPVSSIPDDADVVVCHAELAERARDNAPGVPVVSFQVFLGDPAITRVVNAIRDGGRIDG
jgi:mannitol-specific phosphotransferase system IIBC component